MKRKNIAAGNWKMNKTYDEGTDLAKAIADKVEPSDTIVILGTPFIHLKGVSSIIKDVPNVKLAAQNCSEHESGAYTGDISIDMLKSVGSDYVILGHSERREYYSESDALISKKVAAVIDKGLLPIYCCGEKLEVREANEHEVLVGKQVSEGLFQLSAEDFQKVVIAYEPIGAIGTGVTASPAQAQEMHHYIRGLVAEKYGNEIAEGCSILYGGSVKPGNAKEIFGQPDVDGGLVGGASLKADDFVAIINSF